MADAGGASVFVARSGPTPVLLARSWFGFDLDASDDSFRDALRAFVGEHDAARLPTLVAFAGSGAMAQRLTLPLLRARLLKAAVETRFAQYSGARALYTDVRVLRRDPAARRVHVLAAGVERRLARRVGNAARRAGLRLRGMTALAGLFPAGRSESTVLQVIVEERATTLQLFEAGQLTAIRDVLIGRRDLVAAYQRPILSDRGPVTLSAAQAEALLADAGVPFGRDDELRPGITARQVRPLLNPVLQRLQQELAQTLEHAAAASGPVQLRIRALPAIAGLAEALESELERVRADGARPSSDGDYLAGFAPAVLRGPTLDLRPPAERLAARLARPALVAAACSGVAISANVAEPQRAAARVAADAPVLAALRAQADLAEEWYATAQRDHAKLQQELQSRRRYRDLQPRTTPVVPLLRGVFASAPAECTLTDVRFADAGEGALFIVRGRYAGPSSASVVIDRWMRQLNQSVVFAEAGVTTVEGSGQSEPATFEFKLQLR